MHLHDVYDIGERVPDTQWLADIGDNGWIGVTQNFKIARVAEEREAIEAHRAQVYSLSRANLPAVTQGLVIGRNLLRIFRRAPQVDPGFWRISERAPIRDV